MFPRCLLLAFWFSEIMPAYLIGSTLLDNPQHESCPTAGAPVCATSDGVSYVLFPHQCLLEETNKETYLGQTHFEKIPLGFCLKDCNLNCDTAYSPICATDPSSSNKRTFRNSCEMARNACLTNMDWLHLRNGECPVILHEETPSLTEKTITKRLTSSKIRKAIPCPKVFNPVCAILMGVKSTFINECLVNAENIKTGKDWQIFSEGVCSEDYSNRSIPGIKDESVVSARSYDPNTFEYPNLAAELDDDVNYIFSPPIFQTEYIDDDGNTAQYESQSDYLTNSEDNSNAFSYGPEAPTASALTSNYEAFQLMKPIRFPEEDDAKVTECKYGREIICGSLDGKTRSFGNICELMMRNIFLKQNWTILHKGDCDECSVDCSKEFSPLCVSRNGVNFTIANECYLNSSICHDPQSAWKIVSTGECQSPSTNIEDQYESLEPGFRFTSSYDTVIATTTPITSTIPISDATTSSPSIATSEKYPRSTTAFTTQRPYEDIEETTLRSFYSTPAPADTSIVTISSPTHDYASPYRSAGPSMYGPHRNSIIMRMVETKAVPLLKATSYTY